jgi:hypothetical protein
LGRRWNYGGRKLRLGVDSSMPSDPTATLINLEAAGLASVVCTERIGEPLAVGSTNTQLRKPFPCAREGGGWLGGWRREMW